MARVRRERIVTTQPLTTAPPQATDVIVTEEVQPVAGQDATVVEDANYEYSLAKLNQVIWALISIIELFLVLRFMFLLTGANNVGFAAFIYNLTNIFVAPFRGIFASPAYGQTYFDTAAILAMVMWLVIGFVLTTIIRLFSTRTTEI